MTKEEAIQRTESWWYCDNIVLHRDLIGLLHMGFPRVFILFRNEKSFVCDDFSSWKKGIAEVNFLDPDDRESSDIQEILTDALFTNRSFACHTFGNKTPLFTNYLGKLSTVVYQPIIF